MWTPKFKFGQWWWRSMQVVKGDQLQSTNSEWDFSKLHEIEVTFKFSLALYLQVASQLSLSLSYIKNIYSYTIIAWNTCCFSSCSGIIITPELQHKTTEEFITKGPISKVMGKYKKYKRVQEFPKDFKGTSMNTFPKINNLSN